MEPMNVLVPVCWGISTMLLVWQIFIVWPQYRVDVFRGKLFALRSELFLFAADGHISYSDPAYKAVRESMNAYIRFAHRLTIYHTILTAIGWKLAGDSFDDGSVSRTEAAIGALSPDVRKKIEEFRVRQADLVMMQIFRSTILGNFIFTLFLLQYGYRKGVKDAAQKASSRRAAARIIDGRQLEAEAMREGRGHRLIAAH
jgi:hypothetical protein